MSKNNDYEFADIREQSRFCVDLMIRLDDDIQGDGRGVWSGMKNHCQKQRDIERIRRELMELHKMLNPWRKEEEE